MVRIENQLNDEFSLVLFIAIFEILYDKFYEIIIVIMLLLVISFARAVRILHFFFVRDIVRIISKI